MKKYPPFIQMFTGNIQDYFKYLKDIPVPKYILEDRPVFIKKGKIYLGNLEWLCYDNIFPAGDLSTNFKQRALSKSEAKLMRIFKKLEKI